MTCSGGSLPTVGLSCQRGGAASLEPCFQLFDLGLERCDLLLEPIDFGAKRHAFLNRVELAFDAAQSSLEPFLTTPTSTEEGGVDGGLGAVASPPSTSKPPNSPAQGQPRR